MFVQILLGLIFATLIVIARSLAPLAAMRRKDLARARKCETVIGFGPTVIKARSTMIFNAAPKHDFECDRLIVPATYANDFCINELKASSDIDGKLSANPIPAAAFSELAVGIRLGIPVKKGESVLLSVSNASDSDRPFTAALIGLCPMDQIRDRIVPAQLTVTEA